MKNMLFTMLRPFVMRRLVTAVSRPSTLKTLGWGFLLITILHWVVKFEQILEHGNFQELDIPIASDFVPLGNQDPETFPSFGPYRIPKIIHQTWINTEVPNKFVTWIKTWQKNHPDWEYYLWTDESARTLIRDKYPYLLRTFDSYSEGIRKADALRYIILYEFGGIYADMDLESLRPIDPMAIKYSCFISQEPYEHPILDGNFENLLINALMGCRARHPFMKQLMDNLPRFSHMWNVLDSTGPHFVTLNYHDYKVRYPVSAADDNGTYIAPPEYFFPTIDPAKHFWFRVQCGNFQKLSDIQKKACMNLKVLGVKRKPSSLSFTEHHWIHTYVNFKFSLKGPISIFEIVPKVKIYKSERKELQTEV